MKTVILAGGFGTRISEESAVKPKPMIDIGNRPILWHIMKIYSAHGLNDFVICCGYKGHVIKQFFLDYRLYHASITVNVRTGVATVHDREAADDWPVHLVEFGDKDSELLPF